MMFDFFGIHNSQNLHFISLLGGPYKISLKRNKKFINIISIKKGQQKQPSKIVLHSHVASEHY